MRRCKYVQNRRACYRLRRGGECGVWGHLLDNYFILIKKARQSEPFVMQRLFVHRGLQFDERADRQNIKNLLLKNFYISNLPER